MATISLTDSIFKKLNDEELLLINELYLEMKKYKNIIDKLEKWIKDYLDKPLNDEFDYAIDDTLQMVLDELEELKEKSDIDC